MSTGQPLSRMPKPSAEQYKDVRKLLLVPLFVFPVSDADEIESLLEKYWSEIRDQVQNLERSLGSVTEVFHENVFFCYPGTCVTMDSVRRKPELHAWSWGTVLVSTHILGIPL